jgi:hypothetical protein
MQICGLVAHINRHKWSREFQSPNRRALFEKCPASDCASQSSALLLLLLLLLYIHNDDNGPAKISNRFGAASAAEPPAL